jgi:hypothetical protein
MVVLAGQAGKSDPNGLNGYEFFNGLLNIFFRNMFLAICLWPVKKDIEKVMLGWIQDQYQPCGLPLRDDPLLRLRL